MLVPNPRPVPSGEVLPPEPQPIHEYDEHLREAARAMRQSSMRIAYWGFRMRLSEGWINLGFPAGPRGEDQYRESLQIPRSSWFRLVRIGQALHQLSLQDLERIPITNAEILLSVHPTIWHEFSWLHEARSLPAERLAHLVTERNKKAGGDREPMVNFVARIPYLAKEAIDRMLETFQHKHELSSKGQALELLVAERHDRPSLLGAVAKAHTLIAGVHARLKNRQGMTEEADWLQLAMGVLNEAHTEAVQAARQKSKGVQNNGGRP
jgi:hypothetical protein